MCVTIENLLHILILIISAMNNYFSIQKCVFCLTTFLLTANALAANCNRPDKVRVYTVVNSGGEYNLSGHTCVIEIKDGQNNNAWITSELLHYVEKALSVEGAQICNPENEDKADYIISMQYSVFITSQKNRLPGMTDKFFWDNRYRNSSFFNGGFINNSSPEPATYAERNSTDMFDDFSLIKGRLEGSSGKMRLDFVMVLEIRNASAKEKIGELLVAAAIPYKKDKCSFVVPYVAYRTIGKFGTESSLKGNKMFNPENPDFKSFVE